jgi:hypothetical protein
MEDGLAASLVDFLERERIAMTLQKTSEKKLGNGSMRSPLKISGWC